MFAAKLDPHGNHLWSKRFGDVQSQSGTGVGVSDGKSAILLGGFQGTIDFGGGALTSAAGATMYDVYLAKLLTP